MGTNRYKKLIVDTGLFALSRFGSKVLVFFLVPLYTNVLSTEEYGIVDTVTTITSLLSPVLTILVSEAVLRFSLEKNSNKTQILTVASVFVLCSTVILLLLKPFTAMLGGEWEAVVVYWYWVVAIHFLTVVNSILSNYSRGLDKTKLFAASGVLYTVVLICANLLYLLVLKMGAKGYLLAIMTAEATCIIFYIVVGKYWKTLFRISFSKSVFKQMMAYSIPMVPSNISWWFMQVSDKYVIISIFGIAVSGIYSIAYKIPSILSIVVHIFTQAWQISAIKCYEERESESFIRNVYLYVIMFSVIISTALIALSKNIAYVIYANEYFTAWSYVPLLIVAYHFSGLSGVIASVYTAAKKTGMLFISTSIGAIFNIAFNLLLIPRYGVMAAAYTTMIAFILTWVTRSIHIRYLIRIKLNYWRISLSFTALIFQAVIVSMNLKGMYYVSLACMVVQITIYRCEIFNLLRVIQKFLQKRV